MRGRPGEYQGHSPDRGYHSNQRRRPDAQEEMAKLQSIAVYATAMGGVNEDGGWSLDVVGMTTTNCYGYIVSMTTTELIVTI